MRRLLENGVRQTHFERGHFEHKTACTRRGQIYDLICEAFEVAESMTAATTTGAILLVLRLLRRGHCLLKGLR